MAMVMHANQLIRQAREKLGLDKVQVAELSGLTVPHYYDIEQFADEIFTTVSLKQVRLIFSVLHLDISTLQSEFATDESGLILAPQYERLSRHELLRKFREEINATISEVADAIEFEDAVVSRGESDEEFLESLPISVLCEWSKYVGLPVAHLINS